MIDTQALSQLLFDAFSGKITWMEGSSRYTLDEMITAFHNTRATMQRTLDGLTDVQVAYHEVSNPLWSLSETVTHLIYSQNAYYNQLLDITSTELPHIAEAAKGFGEGAKLDTPADVLRTDLQRATVLITSAIEKTRLNCDPTRTVNAPLFGVVNYHAWILLLLGHELDHVRQSVVMRRLARAATRR